MPFDFFFTLSETSAEKQNPWSTYIVDKIVVSMTTIKQDSFLKKLMSILDEAFNSIIHVLVITQFRKLFI